MFGMNSRKGTVNEDYKTQGKDIKKLKELDKSLAYRLWGYIITKDAGYGKGVLLCSDDFMISLPKRYVEGFEASTAEEQEQIKSGELYLYNIVEVKTNKPGQKDTVAGDIGTYADVEKWLGNSNVTI